MKLLSLLCLIFLAFSMHCRNASRPGIEHSQEKIVQATPFYGEWHYAFPFYSSTLTIHPDGRFTFTDRGCLGPSFTEGKWVSNGPELILTSDEKYRQPVQPMATIVSTGPTEPKKERTRSSDSVNHVSIDLSSLSTTVSFNWPDTLGTFFHARRFRIGTGKLIGLDSAGKETDAVYTRTNIDTRLPKVPVY